MKLNFDNINLYSSTCPVPAFGLIQDLNLPKIRAWWKDLQIQDKQNIFQINSSEIVTKVVETVKKAFLFCTLNSNYKEKALMSRKSCQNVDGEVMAYIYEFDLCNKGILSDNLSQIVSSFSIFSEKSTGGITKSFISIKRQRFDSFFDLLCESLENFGQGQKFVFQDNNFEGLFPSILNYCSQIPILRCNLKDVLKLLFEQLVALSLILERQIYLRYFEQVASGILSQASEEQKRLNLLEIKKYNQNQKNILAPFYSMGSDFANLYEGFYLEDLEITFDPLDNAQIDDDLSETEEEEENNIASSQKEFEIHQLHKISINTEEWYEEESTFYTDSFIQSYNSSINEVKDAFMNSSFGSNSNYHRRCFTNKVMNFDSFSGSLSSLSDENSYQSANNFSQYGNNSNFKSQKGMYTQNCQQESGRRKYKI